MKVTDKYQLQIGDKVLCGYGTKQIHGTVIEYGYRKIGVEVQHVDVGYNRSGTLRVEVRNYKKANKVAGSLGHNDHKYGNQIIILETI